MVNDTLEKISFLWSKGPKETVSLQGQTRHTWSRCDKHDPVEQHAQGSLHRGQMLARLHPALVLESEQTRERLRSCAVRCRDCFGSNRRVSGTCGKALRDSALYGVR